MQRIRNGQVGRRPGVTVVVARQSLTARGAAYLLGGEPHPASLPIPLCPGSSVPATLFGAKMPSPPGVKGAMEFIRR